jgi:hypothetical protein
LTSHIGRFTPGERKHGTVWSVGGIQSRSGIFGEVVLLTSERIVNSSDNSKTTGISTALGMIIHRQTATDTLSQNGNLIAVTSYRIFFQHWFYIETLGQWPTAIVLALPLREY